MYLAIILVRMSLSRLTVLNLGIDTIENGIVVLRTDAEKKTAVSACFEGRIEGNKQTFNDLWWELTAGELTFSIGKA